MSTIKPLDEMMMAALLAGMQKAEPKLTAALAEYGVNSPDELPPEIAREIFQNVMVQTAVESFPGAQVDALKHGLSSFQHPLFSPAFDRVRKQLDQPADAFMVASGIDAAIVLAGFGLPVAPFDRKNPRILADLSNNIDEVVATFSRWKSAYVGYSPCDAPFYMLVTDCVKTMPPQIASRPQLWPLRDALHRMGATLPQTNSRGFQHGLALIPREPADTLSTIFIGNPNPHEGSLQLLAGWCTGDGDREGTPNEGFVPVPLQFLRAACQDPQIAMWIWKPVGVRMTLN